MKVRTNELSGGQLDWAVAEAQGFAVVASFGPLWRTEFAPSIRWAQGGPIIEKEGISLEHRNGDWIASHEGFSYLKYFSYEPLVSAMRCYVAGKLGEEIEIPEGLENV